MIDKLEIADLARELSLDLHIVEKDYVLGWLLAGIAANPELSENWVFKGGTCLKKCYFETYRFSEDLDFTVTEEAQLDEQYLLQAFRQMAEWIYEQSGIEPRRPPKVPHLWPPKLLHPARGDLMH
jgi:predicted nucleotidyltransferase component of viral defense system